MIPKIIHQAWLGTKPIPERELEWQRVIREKHPGFEFRFWTDKNCEDLVPLFKNCTTFGSLTNVLRLNRLKQEGGVWMDMDIECKKSIEPLLNVSAFAAPEYEGLIGNAVLGATPDHPWVLRQLDALDDFVAKTPPPWGPFLATHCLGDDVTIYPTSYFYPYHWKERPATLEQAPTADDTFLIHHWTMAWHFNKLEDWGTL